MQAPEPLFPWMTAALIGVDRQEALRWISPPPQGSRLELRMLAEDPKLAVASMDVVVLSAAYRNLDRPERLLAFVRSAIRPLGRLYLVGRVVPDAVEAAGFDLLSTRDGLWIFQRP